MSSGLRMPAKLPTAGIQVGSGGVAVSVLVLLGFTLSPYYTHILIVTFFAIVLAVSYRLLLHTREASFCHGTFYMFGAYTTALLTVRQDWPFWYTLPLAGIVAALSALVIGLPSLRTTGPYFFLITFGFLVVVGSVAENATSLTGGFSGVLGIGQPAGIHSIRGFYFAALILAVVTVIVFAVFDRSRWGLELIALGDARDLAQATGMARLANMLGAFVVGAFFAGIAGSLYASYITFVSPNSFTLWTSIYVLIYVVVGGSRYLVGAVVGAALLTLFPVWLGWSANLEAVFAAGLTLVIILVAPRGITVELVDRLGSLLAPKGRGPAEVAADVTREAVAAVVEPAAPAAEGAASGEPLLAVRDVQIQFGGVRALAGVTLDVKPRESVGVIGPNGAGKTTLFNCISGFARPDHGDVIFEGRSMLGMAPHRIARLGLVRTFQASVVFERLSVYQNLLVGCRPPTGNPLRNAVVPIQAAAHETARADELVAHFGLDRWARTAAGSVPYGIRKILGVAICVAARPKLLCLDEPMAGLHGAEVEHMQHVLAGLTEQHGIALMLIEHRMPVVMSMCDRVVVLSFGEVLAEGAPEVVRADPRVIEAYLGEETGHARATA
jgi:ABC-type branched-subunit amino acid transport system ATPase component/ABC-type branched-subunit amino acid transport system permease subunit